MQHVTIEATSRLKEAGFPQPEPRRGQVWYDQIGGQYIALSNTTAISVSHEIVRSFSRVPGGVFLAHTATDIMQHAGYSEWFWGWMPNAIGALIFAGAWAYNGGAVNPWAVVAAALFPVPVVPALMLAALLVVEVAVICGGIIAVYKCSGK